MQHPSKILKTVVLIQSALPGVPSTLTPKEVDSLVESLSYSIEDAIHAFGVWAEQVQVIIKEGDISVRIRFAAGSYHTEQTFRVKAANHPARNLSRKVLIFLRTKSESWE